MDQFLTVQEAAELMGVSRFTVWRRIRDGELAAYQSGVDRRARLLKRADVEALMRPAPTTAARLHEGRAETAPDSR